MGTDEALQHEMAFFRAVVDTELERLAGAWSGPDRLVDAMRYALFTGGKRIRPCMALAAAQAVGADPQAALAAGVAIELIHTYSLVHDDLPAMDNDDVRRGQPTVHRRYDEATAILVGDALLTEAFAVLARAPLPADRTLATLRVVAHAAGHSGMVGGQARDIGRHGETVDSLRQLHAEKTGALFVASCAAGAIAGVGEGALADALALYGRYVGESFQLSDDLLDDIDAGNSRDEHEDAVNFSVILGRRATVEQIEVNTVDALAVLTAMPGDTAALRALAAWIRQRAVTALETEPS